MQTDYPPAPWSLSGDAMAIVRLVDIKEARRYVPASAKIVRVWRGKTLGGIVLARYDAGSTLHYNELIVFCGLVRCGLRLGAWISHIYVDNQASMAGGREIWGLPKEIAEFDFTNGVQVLHDSHVWLRLARRIGRLKMPLPLVLPAWGIINGRPTSFAGRGRGLVGLGYAGWEVAPEAPFAEILRSGYAFCVTAQKMRVRVAPPRHSTGRADGAL